MYSEQCKSCIVEGCPDSCSVKQAYKHDLVNVVRCKDCKFYKKTSDGISYCYDHDDDILWQDDDYCSRAERRSDETD